MKNYPACKELKIVIIIAVGIDKDEVLQTAGFSSHSGTFDKVHIHRFPVNNGLALCIQMDSSFWFETMNLG